MQRDDRLKMPQSVTPRLYAGWRRWFEAQTKTETVQIARMQAMGLDL